MTIDVNTVDMWHMSITAIRSRTMSIFIIIIIPHRLQSPGYDAIHSQSGRLREARRDGHIEHENK